jgi:uncharacterized protein YegL
MAKRPGGEYTGRPLHVIWLLDCAGSMAISGKIEALNNAIREVVPARRKAAEGNPEVQFYVRVIRFSSGATWHIAQPTLLADFKWVDLHAEGETDPGQAFALPAEEMSNIPADARMLPPQIVLISDGKPNDDWKSALQAMLKVPRGRRAVRQAIAIGQDADQETLRKLSIIPRSRCGAWTMPSNWCAIFVMSPLRLQQQLRAKTRRPFQRSRCRPMTTRRGRKSSTPASWLAGDPGSCPGGVRT